VALIRAEVDSARPHPWAHPLGTALRPMRGLGDLDAMAALRLAMIRTPVPIAVALPTPVHGTRRRISIAVTIALGVMDSGTYDQAAMRESRGSRCCFTCVGGRRRGFRDLIPDLPACGVLASAKMGVLAPYRHRAC